MKNRFLYELHQHTEICSKCGKADPLELPYAVKEDGFDGVVITNHFYHGNTGVDRGLKWADFVKVYEQSYLDAKSVGDKIGIDVLFGMEEHIGNNREVLIYGVHPQFFYDHPELRGCDLKMVYELVHEAGGLVFQAHPFRSRSYIADPFSKLPPCYLDGVEVHNACNKPGENEAALAFAKENGLLICAGSDAHGARFSERFGIACPHRITSEEELVQVLSNGEYELIYKEII